MEERKPIGSMSGRETDPAGTPGRRLSTQEFAGLLERESRCLWTVAAGVLGDPSEAEDVLQEAALMALGKLEQFDRATDFAAWMGRFVRNVALNQMRKRGRRRTHAFAPEAMMELSGEGIGRNGRAPGGESGGLPVDLRGELRPGQEDFDDLVLEGLRELNPIPRAALLLRTVLGLSYREVARVLEIPEGTAMSHVHRARKSLREHLEGPGARNRLTGGAS